MSSSSNNPWSPRHEPTLSTINEESSPTNTQLRRTNHHVNLQSLNADMSLNRNAASASTSDKGHRANKSAGNVTKGALTNATNMATSMDLSIPAFNRLRAASASGSGSSSAGPSSANFNTSMTNDGNRWDLRRMYNMSSVDLEKFDKLTTAEEQMEALFTAPYANPKLPMTKLILDIHLAYIELANVLMVKPLDQAKAQAVKDKLRAMGAKIGPHNVEYVADDLRKWMTKHGFMAIGSAIPDMTGFF